VRAIADSLNILASTNSLRLVEKYRLKKVLLRWVSHMLTGELWQKRVELVGQSLQVLEGQKRVGFPGIMTGD
jgi:hypothetical protein